MWNDKGEVLFSIFGISKLREVLLNLFGQEIYLRNQQGSYELAYPAFYYVLNYTEQLKMSPSKFHHFSNMGVFKEYFSDLIYSHLGVFDSHINTIKEEKKILEKENKEISKKRDDINEINLEIDKSSSTALDLDNLKIKISFFEEKYRILLHKSNSHKRKLNDAHLFKNKFSSLLAELNELIDSNQKGLNKSMKDHHCESCNNIIKEEIVYYFDKAKTIDMYNIQRLGVESQLAEIEKTIDSETIKYNEIISEIKTLERNISLQSKDINDGIKAMGFKKVTSDLLHKLDSLKRIINNNSARIKEIDSEIRKNSRNITKVDKEYVSELNRIIDNYEITGIEKSKIKKANNIIKVDGTHNNLVCVAWLCALLKVKYKYNTKSTVYPLVFDNPNNADYDIENDTKIFNILFDNLPNNGQIITSSVGFDKNDFEKYHLNKIVLKNEQYKLLNTEDYILCMEKFKNLKIL